MKFNICSITLCLANMRWEACFLLLQQTHCKIMVDKIVQMSAYKVHCCMYSKSNSFFQARN